MQDSSIDFTRNAEAASYVLERRLAPAIRHQMAGGFQPVTMLAAVIEKRLQTANVDLPALVKTSADVRAMAIAATRASLDLLDWLAPDPPARVRLDKGVEDALHLVATELSFRGFEFVNETQGLAIEVVRHHLRSVFMAGLLALTDAAASPANLLVTAGRDGADMVLTLALAAAEPAAEPSASGEEFRVGPAPYRKIAWDDVEAIAAAHGVAFTHTQAMFELRLRVATD